MDDCVEASSWFCKDGTGATELLREWWPVLVGSISHSSAPAALNLFLPYAGKGVSMPTFCELLVLPASSRDTCEDRNPAYPGGGSPFSGGLLTIDGGLESLAFVCRRLRWYLRNHHEHWARINTIMIPPIVKTGIEICLFWLIHAMAVFTENPSLLNYSNLRSYHNKLELTCSGTDTLSLLTSSSKSTVGSIQKHTT
jgi:hypothetical protein